MAYTYDSLFAVDPNAPSNVARNASILLFDPNDATKTAVTLTDITDLPLSNPVTTNQNGFGPAFKHATLDRLGWEGGGMSGVFTSYEGMKAEAVAARNAAETAANDAAAAESRTVTSAAVNGSGNLILTKADSTTVDAGTVVGPKGDKGTDGINGSNVLPTDEAIRDAVNNPASATRGALAAAVVMGKTRAAEGTQTDGQNLILGAFGYIATGGATNSVSGGSPNYENAIGGNTANVSTATSNLTGAPTLVAPDGNWNSIWGGYDNVVNGWANQVQGYHCKIHAGANHGTISGGSVHEILAATAYGSIGGGTQNKVGTQGTVAGGSTNQATGASSSIGGGITNTAAGANAVIGGGSGNTANSSQSTVGGGASNQATNTAATVAGGASNQATNINSTVGGGSTNIASGNGATINGGLTNTASGTSSTVNGGRENTASGEYSTAGGYKAVASGYGARAYASGQFAAAGDAQTLEWVLRANTTDATAKFLQPTGVSFLPALPDSTTWAFELTVAARCQATGESAAYKVTGAIDRGVGAATTALVGTPTVTILAEDVAAWNLTVGAGTGDGSLRFTVTGEAAKSIRWVGSLQVTSVSG